MHGEASRFPLLSNLWGTRERCAEMLGLPPEQSRRELGLLYAELVSQHIEPVVVSQRDAPVQAHVYQGRQADMWMLPGVRHFEMALGPVLTMAHVMHPPAAPSYNAT